MQYTTTITSKGQATIPVSIRKKLGLKPGQKIIFEEHENGVSVKSPSEIIDSLMGSLKSNIKYDKKKAREAVGKMLGEKYEKINRY